MSMTVQVKVADVSVKARAGGSDYQDQAVTDAHRMFDRASELSHTDRATPRRHDPLEELLSRPSPLDRFRHDGPDQIG